MWSAICFAGLSVNNLAAVYRSRVVPDIDLRLARLVPALIGMTFLARLHLGHGVEAADDRVVIRSLTFAYLVAAMHFFRFWRRTADPLFGHFAVGFCLFSLNQLASSVSIVSNETRRVRIPPSRLGLRSIVVAIVQRYREGVTLMFRRAPDVELLHDPQNGERAGVRQQPEQRSDRAIVLARRSAAGGAARRRRR